jgi:KDO2-lipid IV(A) lauroyltransferase
VIVYALWRLTTLLLRLVPLRISYAAGALIANAVFICWHEKRRNTIDNMRQVLSDESDATARRIARSSWRNYGKYLVDFLRAADGGGNDLAASIAFQDRSLIDEAFATGRGVLFILMHQGSWDLGGVYFSRLGYPLNVIVETFNNDRLNSLVVASRRSGGMRVIPMEGSGLKILRALRRNEALAILMDRPYAENGMAVQFFGRETVLPDGPARLALRTGARVITAAVVRSKAADNRLIALVDTDIRALRTGDEREDVRALTEAFLRAHERFIRQYPEQWYMFRRMWRSKPAERAATPA